MLFSVVLFLLFQVQVHGQLATGDITTYPVSPVLQVPFQVIANDPENPPNVSAIVIASDSTCSFIVPGGAEQPFPSTFTITAAPSLLLWVCEVVNGTRRSLRSLTFKTMTVSPPEVTIGVESNLSFSQWVPVHSMVMLLENSNCRLERLPVPVGFVSPDTRHALVNIPSESAAQGFLFVCVTQMALATNQSIVSNIGKLRLIPLVTSQVQTTAVPVISTSPPVMSPVAITETTAAPAFANDTGTDSATRRALTVLNVMGSDPVPATCNQRLSFDSLALRVETTALQHAVFLASMAAVDDPSLVPLTLTYTASTAVSEKQCIVEWRLPSPSFAAQYRSLGPTEVVANAEATAQDDTYATSVFFRRVVIEVLYAAPIQQAISTNVKSCVPFISSNRRALANLSNEILTSVGSSFSSLNTHVFRPSYIAVEGSSQTDIARASLTLINPTFPLYFRLPAPGCSVTLSLVTQMEPQLVWFAWVIPTAFIVIAIIATATSFFRFGGQPDGEWTLVICLSIYFMILTVMIGLGISISMWQFPMRLLPMPPMTSFFAAFGALSPWFFVAAFWNFQGGRSLVISFMMRLFELAICIACCAAFWAKGFVILGTISLVALFGSNVILFHLYTKFTSLLPGHYSEPISPIMSAIMWIPITIPISPLSNIYAAFILGGADGKRSVDAVKLYDAIVALWMVVSASLPNLILLIVACVLHQPFVVLLLPFCAVALWNGSLGLRRYAKFRRQYNLDNGHHRTWSLWPAVLQSVGAQKIATSQLPSRKPPLPGTSSSAGPNAGTESPNKISTEEQQKIVRARMIAIGKSPLRRDADMAAAVVAAAVPMPNSGPKQELPPAMFGLYADLQDNVVAEARWQAEREVVKVHFQRAKTEKEENRKLSFYDDDVDDHHRPTVELSEIYPSKSGSEPREHYHHGSGDDMSDAPELATPSLHHSPPHADAQSEIAASEVSAPRSYMSAAETVERRQQILARRFREMSEQRDRSVSLVSAANPVPIRLPPAPRTVNFQESYAAMMERPSYLVAPAPNPVSRFA